MVLKRILCLLSVLRFSHETVSLMEFPPQLCVLSPRPCSRGQLRLARGLLGALVLVKHSFHLQCSMLRALHRHVLNLSPCSVSPCCCSRSGGQKGCSGVWSPCPGGPGGARAGPCASCSSSAALAVGRVCPWWSDAAGSNHFLTSWALEEAEWAWKVFTKSLDFPLNMSAYPLQPSALLQLLLMQPNPVNCSLVWGLRGWREHGSSAFASGAKDFCSKIVQDAVPNSMHVGYL